MPALPSGTVTLLFTDIEGSTRLLEQLGSEYEHVLAEHRRLIRDAVSQHGGVEVDTQGDAFLCAFARASDAVRAAADAQRALASTPVRVRMGLHTGEGAVSGDHYVGIEVHRAARICAVGHGGQVLLSQATRDAVASQLPPEVSLRDLGEHRLKDLRRPEQYLQLVMTRLWDEEVRAGSSVLRLETLNRLGGAERIVRTHLDTTMSALPPGEQEVAARVFHFLVTPSGTKIAHTALDRFTLRPSGASRNRFESRPWVRR